ncbi:MAG TPA: hypothetical protein PLD14_02955 [Candidatus Pacearchaeota archaeon]|nr:hypothetical protein [Candidatus Pacearchaeota archaeon]HPR80158.1 hypothetical protein [Candidatus Pacearchaeota archaeon]
MKKTDLFEEDMERFMTIDQIRDLTGYDITAITNGMPESLYKNPKGDVVVVQLCELKNYLLNIKRIADNLLGFSPPRDKPKGTRYDGWFNAKEAAKLLNCDDWRAVVDLVKKKKINGILSGRGCYVDPKSIGEFLTKKSTETIPDIGVSISPPVIAFQNKGGNDEAKKTHLIVKNDEVKNNLINDENPIETSNNLPVEVFEKPAQQAETEIRTSLEEPNPSISRETVTIKKKREGCLIGDVAEALKVSPITVRKWITDTKNTGLKCVHIERDDFISPESLSAFLLKQRNTTVLYEEKRLPNANRIKSPV